MPDETSEAQKNLASFPRENGFRRFGRFGRTACEKQEWFRRTQAVWSGVNWFRRTAAEKRPMTSPTGRTLNLLRKLGFVADVVERTVTTPDRTFKRDLFGIGDVLGVHPRDRLVLLVQA